MALPGACGQLLSVSPEHTRPRLGTGIEDQVALTWSAVSLMSLTVHTTLGLVGSRCPLHPPSLSFSTSFPPSSYAGAGAVWSWVSSSLLSLPHHPGNVQSDLTATCVPLLHDRPSFALESVVDSCSNGNNRSRNRHKESSHAASYLHGAFVG